jgi:putative phosphoesterase
MRIAIVSDIHGNLTALEAVIADLREMSPDMVLHGGDLAHGGSSPAEVVDRLRDLGWPGILGNTDEMLFAPETLDEFAAGLPGLARLFDATREIAAVERERLGKPRLEWLRELPRIRSGNGLVLVHATEESTWRAPGVQATDNDLDLAYARLNARMVVYGHVHRPFVRTLDRFTVANSGSVSLSYDGDPRASYLLISDNVPQIRRVSYAVDREIEALRRARTPHAEWIGRMLAASAFEMPRDLR